MSKSEPIRILYMEDDPGSARLFQKRLERAGYVVDIAHDGEEGLAMYEAGSYDVVAVDQTMPVHDGLEVLRILASRGPLPPTIMVTGTGNEQIAVEAMKLGTSDYIVKDVGGEYLKLLPSAIEQALRQQQLAEEEQRAERLLQALNQAALAMGQALTPEEIFAAVGEEFKTLGLSCVVFLADEDQSRLSPRYLGYEARAIKAAEKLVGLKTEDFSIPVETVDLYREVVWERKTVFLENAEEAMRQVLPGLAKRFTGHMVRMLKMPTFIAAPLIVEDKVIGVLSVQSDDLTESDVPAITAFAHQMAAAWRKGTLMQELRESLAERKRVEEELRSSEQRLKVLFEFAPDAYYLSDLKGNFIDGNKAAEELTGYPRSELIGKSFLKLKLLSPRQIPKAAALLAKNVLGRPTGPDEFTLNRKDGRQVAVEIGTFQVQIEGQTLVLGIARDITERKRAEEALRESEEKYRTILENIEDGYFEVDIAGNFTFFNDSLCKLLGYPKDELMGMNNRGYMDDEDARKVYQAFNTVYRTRKPAEVFDWEVIRKDGTKRFVEASVSLIRDPTGEPVGFRGVVRDITERKREEEEIRQQTAQLEALRQVGLELTAQLDLDMLLRSIVSRAIELLEGSAGGLDLYQPERDVLEWTASISPDPVPGNPVIRRGEGLSGKVWETGKPLIVDDYRHWEGQAAVYKDYPFAAIVGVPVRWGDEFLGVLQVHTAPPRTFAPADAELLSLLATQAATAIRNAHLYEAERKRVAQLAVVNQVARQAASILDPDSLLQEIVSAIQQGFKYHTVSLFLLDEAASEMERVAMSGGFKDVAVENYHQAVGVGMIGWTAETGQPLLANDVSQEPRYIPGFLGETSAGSELCVPLRLAGRVIGVLDVQDARLNAFDEGDLMAMETLADQIAVAIENARLYEEAQQELTERKRVEEALRVSEERFALAVRGSNDGLWDWDIQNNSLYWSLRLKELLGYADDELEVDFDTFESHLHPDGREHTGAAIEAHLKDRGLYDVEQRLRTKSGEYRWFRARGQALWDEAGNPVRMIGFTTDMTERKRAEEEISRRNHELAALNTVAEALSTSLELQDILDQALSRTVQALGFAGGLVALADERTGDLVLFSYTDLPRPFVEHLETDGLSGTLCEFVYREGKPLGLEDLHEDAPVEVGRLLEAGLQSYMGAPIVHKGRALGTFCLFGTAPHPVSETDYALLTAIGQQVGVALENGRLYEQARQRVRELQLLHEVGMAAASGVRLEETLQATVKALAAELGDTHVGIALLDQESGALYQKAAIGYLPDGMHDLRIPPGKGITDWVVQHGEPALVPDVRLDPRYYEGISDIRSELCVPLVAGSQVIGVLNVESPQPNAFTDDDQRLLSTLANNLAVLVERARLFEEVEAAGIELQQRAEALEEVNVRLQELDRLKSQFLANMSHELRTPLNSVIGFSEVLIDGFVGQVTPDQKECLENIRSSGHHLLSLINDILDLSKIEAGRMELEPTTFDVAGLLAEVQMTVAPMIQKKSQVLAIEQADSLPPLTADRFRIKQVLLNLLSNGYKFTPVEGHITLSCRLADPATMLFSVADSGIGIKPEDQEIVFEEFRQADGSAAREMTGTGLGLSISKRLIEMHGGRIWVESEYGHGATFSVLLPLAGPLAAEPDAAGETAPPSGNKTVLVVEDDHQFSNLLAFYLRQEGYTPVQHFNGLGALEQARESRPAFITLDIMLPDQDGWEILRALKSDPQTKDIPVLIISALDDGELALSLGAVDYLIKPIRREDLHRLLDRLAAPDPLTRHVTVLAVDDDPGVIKLLQQMLPAESYTLLAAYDGKQGLTLARGEDPDVILLDLLMPGMSGFEVLEKLRADAETVDIPVIVLTAKDVNAEERKLLNDHIQGLMRKSGLTPQSILAQLRRLEALRQ